MLSIDLNRLRELVAIGRTVAQLTRELPASRTAVKHWCLKLGLAPVKSPRGQPPGQSHMTAAGLERRAEAKRLRAEGLTGKETAARLGVTRARLYQLLGPVKVRTPCPTS